ncbi:hypothetical protein [Streptococcus thoraltensis]|uniref:hypothetical protein n=1 Tax=Streptococcus thoraltensis TaxID=55085 RepID=UPI001F5A2747|nr:hypothetical protein [Streptococcus thoraltensis]
MLANIKKQAYMKSIFMGLTALILPTFFSNSDIPKIEVDKLTDGQKVNSDYRRSVEGIKKEVIYFEKRF